MLATIFMMVFISILVLPSILWLYALVDVGINEFYNFGNKVAWLLFLICFPPITTILYLLLGRDQRSTRYKAGKTVTLLIFIIPLLLIIAADFHYFTNHSVQPNIPGSIRI